MAHSIYWESTVYDHDVKIRMFIPAALTLSILPDLKRKMYVHI